MRKRIIIDCDPGIDDSLAIMMALALPDVEICGITIVAGNSPVQMGFENAKKVLHFMERLDIPVYVGANRPLKREFINALDTHGEDGLGESFLPEIPGYEQKEDALTFYRRILREQSCSVLALGPMTNLALLAQEDEEAFSNITQIVSMGGSYKSHGNCSPVAEYNYWCDPDAAALVFDTCGKWKIPLTMVGLDVTREIVLTPNRLAYLKRMDKKIGEFVEKITGFYMDFHWAQEHLIGCVINDPLAVACFYDPSICSGFSAFTQVETEGISRGQTVIDRMNFYGKAPNAAIMTTVDTDKFFTLFFSCILKTPKEDLDNVFKNL